MDEFLWINIITSEMISWLDELKKRKLNLKKKVLSTSFTNGETQRFQQVR